MKRLMNNYITNIIFDTNSILLQSDAMNNSLEPWLEENAVDYWLETQETSYIEDQVIFNYIKYLFQNFVFF